MRNKSAIIALVSIFIIAIIWSTAERTNIQYEEHNSVAASTIESSSRNVVSESFVLEQSSSEQATIDVESCQSYTELDDVSRIDDIKAESVDDQQAGDSQDETYNDVNTDELEVPVLPDFKSWTNYVQCVSRNSPQWAFLNSDGTYTDKNGFRRKGDDYMVAMGSYYTTTLGDRFLIETEYGNSFTVTICDFKSDDHTDDRHQYSISNNCLIEFYVDDTLCSSVKLSGNASSVHELSGMITHIEKMN